MAAASSSSSRYTGSAMGDLILGQHRGKRPQRSRRACDVCGRIACSPWWGGLIIKNNSSGGVAWHHVAGGRLPGGLLRYSAGLWFAGWAGLRCFSLLGGKDTLSLTVATLARTTHPYQLIDNCKNKQATTTNPLSTPTKAKHRYTSLVLYYATSLN
jgi:hypothetical protein